MGADSGKAIDAGRCPLCGGGNGCGSVAKASTGSCWCVDEKFPPTLFELLPEGTRNQACICQACLKAHTAE